MIQLIGTRLNFSVWELNFFLEDTNVSIQKGFN